MLRPVAVAAAHLFGLDPVAVKVVAHAFNTTFSVETVAGGRFALRVNTNSQSTPQNVVAQQAWQCAIASETDVLVAAPRATPEGQWYVAVDSEAFGRRLMVTAASWLDGPDVVEMDLVVAHQLGRTMALLHEQSQGWAMPPGASMPRFDTPLFGDQDLLSSAPGLSPPDRATLGRAREKASAAFTALYGGAPVQPLHADLHGGNLKWNDGRLAVFDFDDCGLGVPSLDLAIAVFYLRGDDPRLEAALTAGYAEKRPLPDVDPGHFEAMIAARQLLLANSLLTSVTSDLQRDASGYLAVTVSRLRHWLMTGTFTRTPPSY